MQSHVRCCCCFSDEFVDAVDTDTEVDAQLHSGGELSSSVGVQPDHIASVRVCTTRQRQDGYMDTTEKSMKKTKTNEKGRAFKNKRERERERQIEKERERENQSTPEPERERERERKREKQRETEKQKQRT